MRNVNLSAGALSSFFHSTSDSQSEKSVLSSDFPYPSFIIGWHTEKKFRNWKFEFFLALHFWSRNASYLQFLPRWPHLGSKVANIQQANVHQFETNSRKPCYNSNFTDSIDSVKRKASQREGKPISFRFYLPLSFYNILDRAYRPETTDFHWSVEQAIYWSVLNKYLHCVYVHLPT